MDSQVNKVLQVDMEEALRRSEEAYRSLVESTRDAILHLDLERNIISCNEAFLKMFGLKREEAIGQSISLVHVSEESFHSFGKRVYSEIKMRGYTRIEWEFKKSDGTIFPTETTTSAIMDREGNISGYVSIVRDITERKRAEQALKKSEERYRQLVENLNEGIVVGQEGMLKFVNPAMTRISGYTETELLSTPWIEFIYSEDREVAKRHHLNRIQGKEVPNVYSIRILTKDGEIRWVEIRGVVIEWDGKPATLNFLTDVTERRLAEEEFHIAHRELEDLIRSLSSILIELTPEWAVKRWNKVAEKVFGLVEGKAVGMNIKALPVTWELDMILDGLRECRTKAEAQRIHDIPFGRQDGTRGFLGMTITPKMNEQGQISGFIILASDITERRNLETQLLQAQKLESVGHLAAGIAHEINTPTQFVGDNIQFLQESFEDLRGLFEKYKQLLETFEKEATPGEIIQEIRGLEKEIDLPFLMEEIPKAIEQSIEGVKRIAKIVRAMKEFSHPGTGEKTFLDINKAIENTITVTKNEWKYVAEMETNLDPSLPAVPCLPGEFNQVILNMIINAAHAISDVVEAQGGKGKITITTSRADGHVEIRISDTGTGIPGEIRERIFDPFFTTKEVGKGTGQGLAIARSMIVDKHNGTIEVETEVGKGTTFIIRLPLEDKLSDGKQREKEDIIR